MASSSVARMPADHASWPDGGSAASSSSRRGLKGIAKARLPQSRDVFARGDAADSQPSSPPSPSSSCSDASSPAVGPSSSCCSPSRQQSRVLDRWAAHLSRQMVTTGERQAHEAELSALSATSKSVSSRAATFLQRETSPPPPPPSSSGGRDGVGDLPPNVRASSLIQMWRELEADAGMVPSPRVAGGALGSNLVPGSTAGGGVHFAEGLRGTSDACDDSEWGSDQAEPSRLHSGSSADGEKERVWDAVKRLSSGFETQTSRACCGEDKDPFGPGRPLLNGDNADAALLPKGIVRKLRRWRRIDGLFARTKQERQQELDRLAERHPVSRFSHRNRIQSLLRFRDTHRLLAIQRQHLHDSTALEWDSLQKGGSTIWLLRERYSSRCQQSRNVVQVADDKSIPIISQNNSSGRSNAIIEDEPASTSPQDQEALVANDSQNVVQENSSLTTKDLQDDCQTSDFAWQESTLQIINIDWQAEIDSSKHWDGGLGAEESEAESQSIVEDANDAWSSNSLYRYVGWGNHRQAVEHDLSEAFPDNVEIRELLKRKPVSTSLTSKFREIMDRLVLSLVERQQSVFQSNDEEEIQPVLSQSDEFRCADQDASSLSMMALPFQIFHSPGSQHGSCMTNPSSHQFLETELIQDLRNDMAEIHHEMADLHQLIESCMDGQSKLQKLIREEVSSMVYNSVGITFLLHSAKWAPRKKGNCCVCCEMQIDSLLYRCGHMCTCYNCAQELQWGTGRCPICRAPITDVVRAYSEA